MLPAASLGLLTREPLPQQSASMHKGGVSLPDAQAQWRAASDDSYMVLNHTETGTVIELVRHSRGWFQCRDAHWQVGLGWSVDAARLARESHSG